ncbi:MAG: DUF3800 domain-containing protein [Candidatus Thermoplasmatota archaeon]|nr:DUF3800 domain-containing protein [Candidatus Thermoplasmatota archaeon]
MEFAFLDESGDLGARGSNYLVLTLVIIKRRKDLVRLIVDVKKRLLDKKKGRKWLNSKGGEIKFYGFPDNALLKNTISAISKMNIDIYFIAIDKKGQRIDHENKELILGYIFDHVFYRSKGVPPEKVIADLNYFKGKKRKHHFILEKGDELNQRDHHYNMGEITKIPEKGETIEKMNENSFVVRIEQRNSRSCEELQITDLISGSIFQKFENHNHELFNILCDGLAVIVGKIRT